MIKLRKEMPFLFSLIANIFSCCTSQNKCDFQNFNRFCRTQFSQPYEPHYVLSSFKRSSENQVLQAGICTTFEFWVNSSAFAWKIIHLAVAFCFYHFLICNIYNFLKLSQRQTLRGSWKTRKILNFQIQKIDVFRNV